MINKHPFDVEIAATDTLVLMAEELPDQVQNLSDCLGTASSFSTNGCVGSFSSVGSIISCGG
jgi:hypothetical protein